MPLQAGQVLAHYRLVEKIGEGGMGVVWKAVDTTLDREVAIKVLPEVLAADPERLGRFEREAKLLASLNHPNIATIHGLHEIGGIRFLAMELMSGEDLSQRLTRGALPIKEALNVGRQVAEALEAAHENGIIHRDLKPANIQLTVEGNVKVLDFGLAKAFAPDASVKSGSPSMSPTLTSEGTAVGMILGTAAYMSPEQAKGKPVDRRADIWAFGVVLYEMLVGEKLFDGETISETLAAVLLKEADLGRLPRETPAQVQALAERCLRKDPKLRLRDIGEARIVLAEQLGGVPASSIMIPASETVVPPVSKRRQVVPWATAILALVAALTFGVLFIKSQMSPEQVIRASIPPPPGTQFHITSINPGPVQVSPDGSQIMFVTSNPEGQRILWVRRLDAATAHPLQGTNGAQYPFWSADNKQIGFFSDGKLKKIPATGGPPLSLADASNGKGGSWSLEGNILFAPTYGSAIYLVSAAGGTAKPVTHIDHEAGEDSHRHPHFLPDGRHFLYVARHGGGFGREETGGYPVMIGSIDGMEPRELFRSESNVTYAMGHLLFVRENTLMARPFDAGSRELTGDAFPLAEGVVFLSGAVMGLFSSSQNGVLIYLTGEAQTGSRLVWWDAEGKEIQSFGEHSNLALGRISPDQRHIAFTASEKDGANYDIWIYEIARGVRSRFTFHGGFDSNPVWSPDGKQIAFGSTREGRQDLFVKPFTGSGEAKPLLVSDKDKQPTDWSPDGKVISFLEDDPNGGQDLWFLPLEGEKKPYPLTPTAFRDGGGRFSPDGKWYAYHSNESGSYEIYVRYLPDPGRKWQISTQGGNWPAWRQDGEEIYYSGLDGQILAVTVKGEGDNFRVGTPRSLFATDASPLTSYFSLYDASRDGTRFLLQRPIAENQQDPLTLVVNWPEVIPRP